MHTQNPVSASLQRVLVSFLAPLLGGVALSTIVRAFGGPAESRALNALLLGGVGIVTLLLGLSWYRLSGLGLRGGRPLYAGIGFATLGWLAFLFARFALVSLNPDQPIGSGLVEPFVYLLLFESLSVQLWLFGLLFRSMADWRGPLTAAFFSGILFGAIASQLFESSFFQTGSSIFYFIMWGIFYGMIRLRTGSILGVVLIQAMHLLTAWYLFVPDVELDLEQFTWLYLVAGAIYLLLVWRLWPREEDDYRV